MSNASTQLHIFHSSRYTRYLIHYLCFPNFLSSFAASFSLWFFLNSLDKNRTYWVTQKLPQICTVILRICIGKVAWFAVCICGNFWVTQYLLQLIVSHFLLVLFLILPSFPLLSSFLSLFRKKYLYSALQFYNANLYLSFLSFALHIIKDEPDIHIFFYIFTLH